LKRAPRDPDHPAILADLDPELHGLPLGIPAGVLGEVKIDYRLYHNQAEIMISYHTTVIPKMTHIGRPASYKLFGISFRRVTF
jgi:hypothetical protein